jgi:hypothetical protein
MVGKKLKLSSKVDVLFPLVVGESSTPMSSQCW